MRVPLILAALLSLSACGKNDQADNTQNIDENLSAESIVSNDVTAIDAVTGDAANMAADVDMNYGNLDQNEASATLNESTPRPSKAPPPRKSAPAAETNPAAKATANPATTNSE